MAENIKGCFNCGRFDLAPQTRAIFCTGCQRRMGNTMMYIRWTPAVATKDKDKGGK